MADKSLVTSNWVVGGSLRALYLAPFLARDGTCRLPTVHSATACHRPLMPASQVSNYSGCSCDYSQRPCCFEKIKIKITIKEKNMLMPVADFILCTIFIFIQKFP